MSNIGAGTRVLVVDDDPFVLKLLSRQLAQLGFQDVATFERATCALALLEQGDQPVDLILSDLQMPEMDGIEFVRNLGRAGYDGSLLLVSGEEQRVLRSARRLAAMQGLNVIGVLQKPASAHQLRAQLAGPPAPARDDGHGDDDSDPMVPISTQLRDALREAVAKGAVATCFQPKVRFSDGGLCGVEALARWYQPHGGLLPVDGFIGLAEQEGLIGDVTRIALDEALAQCRRWYDAGLDLPVAVNLSAVCLTSLDLPDVVEGAAARAGVALSRLMLELTQSQMRLDPVLALDVLTRLRLKGVALSIDDFGSGHASLAQLREIPFGELKLGPALIHGVAHDAGLQAIVDATLTMARQLGLQTVAQGLAAAQDWAYLRDHGCDMAQGPFIGMPIPAAELLPWRDAWDARRAALCGMPGLDHRLGDSPDDTAR